jgi:hypothetical protein
MVVNCEQMWKEISNYIEGDVDAGLRAAMDEHFRTCKRCTSVLEGMRNVVQLYGDERMIEVPTGFGRRLERRLAQETRVRRSTWSTWSAWLIPVAALALIAGGLRLANSLTVAHPLRSEHAQAGHNIPPDMPVVVSEGAKEFHVAGCEFIHNKDKIRRLTAKEAIREGYVPCVRCMRKYLQIASAARQSADSEAELERSLEEDDRARGQ